MKKRMLIIALVLSAVNSAWAGHVGEQQARHALQGRHACDARQVRRAVHARQHRGIGLGAGDAGHEEQPRRRA